MPHFEAERLVELDQMQNRIDEMYQALYAQRQPIGGVQFTVTGQGLGPARAPKRGWKPFDVANQQRWGGYDQTTWFRMQVTVPKEMRGGEVVALVRPSLTSYVLGIEGLSKGAEALTYINGVPYQGLDFNRDEVLLTKKAKGGETFEIHLEGVPSTRWDVYHHFGYADIAVRNPIVWDFYWDCQVALEVCRLQPETSALRGRMHAALREAIWRVNLNESGTEEFNKSIKAAQRSLRAALKEFHADPADGKLTLTGHAHIDTAWLWPLRETERKCSRTFSTVLRLMERYPEFHFSCSQPAQYEWIRDNHPELYKQIKKRVKEGRWECCGAPYVEPDCNIPSGESLVRQFLFGNRFFQKEFGLRSNLAWQPDAFGYTWQLPQIMRKSGLEAFVTTKIDWGQYTSFPYSFFQWEGADGSRIPTIMPPLNYNGNPVPEDLQEQWTRFKQKDMIDELPFPFGWGDGGGGPTMAMIEHGKRLTDMPGVPQCRFGTNAESIDRMFDGADMDALPVYNDELYLELHRGCQTSQADVKKGNRYCEAALRDAELLGAIALSSGGTYEKEKLDNAWKKTLLNQFHDILPGSSITEVYDDANRDYAYAIEQASQAQESHEKAICKDIDTTGEGIPLVIFNTLSWYRDGIVAIDAPAGDFHILDPDGETVPHQRSGDDILFIAEGIPSMGHAVYRIVKGKKKSDFVSSLSVSKESIENAFLKLTFDKLGRLHSVYDKLEQRESVAPGASMNTIQFFDDRPALHDAWDIDHNIEDKQWELGAPDKVQVIEKGPVRATVRFTWKMNTTTITQDVSLAEDAARAEFKTHVDWQERRTLMKAAFPIDVRTSTATYEIAYGAIERPTHVNTAADKGRHEVAGHRWADLSEGDYGVSILNDCKYGWDAKGNVLRLSLLRGSIDPDPHADEGEHTFTYAIYPHAGSWRNGTVQEAMELNAPLFARETKSSKGSKAPERSFAISDVDNVIIDTIKRAEDSDEIIVRLYEAYGQRGEVTLYFDETIQHATECDLMEENDTKLKHKESTIALYIKPFEIRTLKLKFKK